MKNSPIAALALELFKDLQVSLSNRLYRDSAIDVMMVLKMVMMMVVTIVIMTVLPAQGTVWSSHRGGG